MIPPTFLRIGNRRAVALDAVPRLDVAALAAALSHAVDDGSRIKDGTQTEIAPGVIEDNLGVRIEGQTWQAPGDFVNVIGLSSCFKDTGGNLRRKLLPSFNDEPS